MKLSKPQSEVVALIKQGYLLVKTVEHRRINCKVELEGEKYGDDKRINANILQKLLKYGVVRLRRQFKNRYIYELTDGF